MFKQILRCSEHGKGLTLFCKETQCQTLICTICMTRKHKKHDVVDVDENRMEELLNNLTSSIEILSFKKEEITTVQKSNERCLKTLKEEKRRILNLVRDKYDSLIQEAENQTIESRSKMVSVAENLILLDNIKQYTSRETLLPKEVKNYQEAVNSVKEHNIHAPLELYYLEYTASKDNERLVEELCGELLRKNLKKERTFKRYKPPGLTRSTLSTQPKPLEEKGKLLMKRFNQPHQIRNICGSFEKCEEPLAASGMGKAFLRTPSNLREFEPRTRTIFAGSPKRRVLPRFQRKLN